MQILPNGSEQPGEEEEDEEDHKPLCRAEQKKIYGIARNEEAKILCEVDSYPPPLSFRWSFNNTAETFEVPQKKFRTGTRFLSTLMYKPITDMDYGTVMCWAKNSAGEQSEPCVFHVIAAGHPDPPFNCTVLNQTTISLEVECIEGFDGGQPQWFFVEVRDGQTGKLQANISNKFPLFSIAHLSPGQVLGLLVTAVNNKGRSDSVFLEGFTLKVAEKQTGTPVTLNMAPVLGYLVGGSLLVLALALIAGIAWRKFQSKSPDSPVALPLKDKVALPLRSDMDDLYEMDDKNPDVVPCNKVPDTDYQLVAESLTPELHGKGEGYDDEAFGKNTITRNGGIHENFQNGLSRLPNSRSNNSPSEVTYAELCIARPDSIDSKDKSSSLISSQRTRQDPTIYAVIDHNRRPPGEPLKSPLTPMSLATGAREIVTVRTPLMGHQQESCV
ncbi:hypothetical protein RUM44_001213 [Polyplax serrata]|uniref:Ig-like domain-containing protein n=1 Tax=Polyplax serrata TaxID=468196 RepID=A0ABR1B6U1_POLSC